MAWWTTVTAMTIAIIALLLSIFHSSLLNLASASGPAQLLSEPLSQRVLGINASPAATEDWNIFYHQGGNSPWIPKISGIVQGGIEPPAGCRVDQVHMVGLEEGPGR